MIALNADGMTSKEDRQGHPRHWESTGWGEGDHSLVASSALSIFAAVLISYTYNILQFTTAHTLSPSAAAFGGNVNKCAALLWSINVDSCLAPRKSAHSAALMRSIKADGSGSARHIRVRMEQKRKPRYNGAIEEQMKVNCRTFDIIVTPPLEEIGEAAAKGCRFGAL